MNRTTQSNFISMLLKGIYYEGYIEGIGVACSGYIPVSSTTCPLPYDPFVTRGTIWSHNIEKLVIRPLRAVDPIRPQIRNEELRNIYIRTIKPNFSPELKSWTERLEQEARKLITQKTAKLNKLKEEVNATNISASKIEKKTRKIVKL